MEDSPVMPDVETKWREFHLKDIVHKPLYSLREWAQPPHCHVYCFLRNIENANICVSAEYKIIRQRGFAAADINDGR